MIFKDIEVEIGRVFLDPFNPRFLNPENSSQEMIAQKIFMTKEAKELLNSMIINIKWVNKIVVLPKENFNSDQMKIPGIENCDYLVVEGNNRLACLKSGKIPNYNNNTKIPVILAKKEENESREDFEAQLRVTQGIANVMVVKEWSVIAKARHLYKMYCDMMTRTKDLRPYDCYRKISFELGISVAEVRQSVVRYEFFKTISEISDCLPEEHWGYLEAFDKNKSMREKFGMSSETDKFNLEDNEGYIEEILKEIPSLIKKAAHEGINTKQFRDLVADIFKDIDESDKLLEEIQYITDPESSFSFRNLLSNNKNLSEKETWLNELAKAKMIVESFPTMASWAPDVKNRLLEISSLIQRHINAFK